MRVTVRRTLVNTDLGIIYSTEKVHEDFDPLLLPYVSAGFSIQGRPALKPVHHFTDLDTNLCWRRVMAAYDGPRTILTDYIFARR